MCVAKQLKIFVGMDTIESKISLACCNQALTDQVNDRVQSHNTITMVSD